LLLRLWFYMAALFFCCPHFSSSVLCQAISRYLVTSFGYLSMSAFVVWFFAPPVCLRGLNRARYAFFCLFVPPLLGICSASLLYCWGLPEVSILFLVLVFCRSSCVAQLGHLRSVFLACWCVSAFGVCSADSCRPMVMCSLLLCVLSLCPLCF